MKGTTMRAMSAGAGAVIAPPGAGLGGPSTGIGAGSSATGSGAARRRPSVQITMNRATRLYRLVRALSEEDMTREALLKRLGVGLRTFYRELELLKKCGVRVKLFNKKYVLQTNPAQAEGKLPFPDPQLTFAELRELAGVDLPAGRRLAELLTRVTSLDSPKRGRTVSRKTAKAAESPAPAVVPAPESAVESVAAAPARKRGGKRI